MLQPSGEPDFLQEPLGPKRLREMRVQNLERDHPVVPEVAREIDRRHSTLAELALNRVAIAEGLDKLWNWLRHVRTDEAGITRICGQARAAASPDHGAPAGDAISPGDGAGTESLVPVVPGATGQRSA